MKKIFLFILFLFFLFPSQAFGYQTESSTVTTRVGNPVVATGSGTLSDVFEWDTKIVNSLRPGLWGYLNNLSTALTNNTYSTGAWAGTNKGNLYWCTYSIVDSFNLAGVTGLSKAKHAAVVTMRSFWKSSPSGYRYVDYQGSSQELTTLATGYAIFFELLPGEFRDKEHVAMIKTVSIDSRGNGFIETQDSNSSTRTHKYPVSGWSIMSTPYPVRGFGGLL